MPPYLRSMAAAVIVMLVTALGPLVAEAQRPDPVGAWFTKHNASIRKVFDGSKDEQTPASFFIVHEPTGKDRQFMSADVALKISEKEWNPTTSSSILLYPVADYHRSTNSAKAFNKAGVTLKAEVRPVGLRTPTPADATTGMPPTEGTYWPVAPTFIVDAKYARDWVSNTSETRYSVQLFATSKLRGFPGYQFRSSDGAVRGRYYPYVGVEQYRFGAATADTTASVGVARLWLEAWPVTTPTQRFVQLTADLTGRQRLSGDNTIPKALSDVALGATLYLDGYGHVGIGIDYANGRDATQRFARREKTTVGLKVKF